MTFLDGLVLSGFLTTAFQWRGVLPIDIRLVYLVAVAVLCYTTRLGGLQINRQVGVFLLAAGATSLLGVEGGRTNLRSVAAQLAGMSVFSTALFAYFRLNRDQVVQRVGWLLRLMFYMAILGIVQEIAYLAHFRWLYDINYLLPGIGIGPATREGLFLRVFSVFSEPGHFGIALTPAVYVAVNVLFYGGRSFYSRLQAITVILALLLTFSSVGYTGLVLSLLVGAGPRRAVRALILLTLVASAALFFVANFRSRVFGILELAAGGESLDENASSLIFYLNGEVAKASFLAHPLWGSGLGSHFLSYSNYLTQAGLSQSIARFLSFMKPEDLNRDDAYAMLLRLPSELGLLGVLSAVYFFVSNRVRIAVEPYRMLSGMCVAFFLTYCVREGHYFRFELWYFLALYAYLRHGAMQEGDAVAQPQSAPASLAAEAR